MPLIPLLCIVLCLVVPGCQESEPQQPRRIVSVDIQGYSLGDVLSEQAQASLFEPEDPSDTDRVHRVSDTGRLPRIMLDPRNQICQVEGELAPVPHAHAAQTLMSLLNTTRCNMDINANVNSDMNVNIQIL